MKVLQHFKTVSYHKWLVMKGCFSIGLYRQGICHDLSKYSPTEFFVGARFYQGNRSPNNAEREAKGYSEAWLHHKGRNKHHYEYWIDYSTRIEGGGMAPAPMPVRYILEMTMDRIAASKVYARGDYSSKNPLDYYLWGRKNGNTYLHRKTKGTLELLLQILAKHGEKEMVGFIKREILPQRERWDRESEWPALIKRFQKEYQLQPLEESRNGKGMNRLE